MTKEELLDVFEAVVKMMQHEFDSHEFIKKLMQYYTVLYGNLLIKYKSISATHGQISIILKDNSNLLNIKSNGRNNSYDVFNEITECELWIKKENSNQ